MSKKGYEMYNQASWTPPPGSPSASDRYCLKCQAPLPAAGDNPKCTECGWQFNPDDPATYRTHQSLSRWTYWFPGFCLAVASGVISYAICLQSGEMGLALFIAVPISIGAILGYGTRPTWAILILLGIAAVGSVVLALVSMNFAGFFCGLTLSLIFVVPVMGGIVLGLLLRAWLMHRKWDHRWYFPLIFFIALPYAVQGIENVLPRRVELAIVRTGLTVHATPQEAWNAIMFYEEVEHAPPWLLRLALPKPIKSVGDKRKEGETIRCFYDRGHLCKRISQCEPGRLLAFEVTEQELHFERDVLLRDGSFEISPSGPETTRITLTTRYQRRLSPRWLWEPIERRVVHNLHGHVLKGMKEHAEKSQNPTPADDNPRYRQPDSTVAIPVAQRSSLEEARHEE
jgi:hypothetical protein